jgi:PAS domain S-box-containing protein
MARVDLADPISRPLSTDMAPNHPSDQDAAVAALLRRVAATAGVHMYEMELFGDFDYVCHVWIGQALESLLGGVPEGMDKEAAWEACIHPDDRADYEAAFEPLQNGDVTEIEYRLVGFDGATRWVWERCIPRPVVDGRRLVDGIVTDITDRHLVERSWPRRTPAWPTWPTTTTSPGCPTARSSRSISTPRWPARAATAPVWPCCSSTWTGSSR